MTIEEYFAGYESSFSIYCVMKNQIDQLGPYDINVSKSQVAFRTKHGFAYFWIPARYLRKPGAPLVLSIPLRSRSSSGVWKEIAEPRKGWFMHHLEISEEKPVGAHIVSCLKEAYEESKK